MDEVSEGLCEYEAPPDFNSTNLEQIEIIVLSRVYMSIRTSTSSLSANTGACNRIPDVLSYLFVFHD